MSSSHQAKRPYAGSQPSITSYFPMTSPTSQPSYTITPQSLNDTQAPALPANVQSNLLSVGMRVRKSVPEGYKTGTYSAFTLFQDTPPAQETKSAQRLGTRPRARELTPFCGILKVGGMAQQQWGIYDNGSGDRYGDEEDADDEDDTPVLSQGSTVSNASTSSFGSGANKRRFDLDDDDDGDDQDMKVLGLAGRSIAVPRRMKKSAEKAVRVVGQENLGDVDFEDAEFLDYGLVGGGDEEMGGV